MAKRFEIPSILSVDISCLLVATIAAYLFRFDFEFLHKIKVIHAIHVFGVSLVVYLAIFFIFKMHRIIWRYASLHEMLRVTQSVIFGYIINSVAVYSLFGFHYVPISIMPLQAFFYLALLVASRALYRFYKVSNEYNETSSTRVLLIGAGQAADGLLRDMLQHSEKGYKPVGILDDNKSLRNRSLRGVKVIGPINDVDKVIAKKEPDLVVFAIPSIADKSLLNNVYNECNKAKVPLRVLPGLLHITQGRVNIDELKRVEIEDLLGREPVSIINNELIECLHGKVVLVTGGGGSIGSELCRQIAMNRPKALSVVDNCEYNLYKCHAELTKKFPGLDISISLTDVSSYHEVERWISKIKPEVIFHAAAYKHVPMLESQIFKAVKNNVLGTQNIADIACKYDVETFVLVSTDKAVNPTNIMGMTKRLAEIYCQTKNKTAKTNFITVRFGNVLGSNGSVLPLFRQQLAAGGPLTVTHPDMTRYFMMIPEAVTLILQSYLLGKGGEIFVLEMGEPVKIVSLAEKLISLSGQEPYKQVGIQFTGIRPGEKLFEEIFHEREVLAKTSNTKILISQSREYAYKDIAKAYGEIRNHYLNRNGSDLIKAMSCLVPEYRCINQKGVYKSEEVFL